MQLAVIALWAVVGLVIMFQGGNRKIGLILGGAILLGDAVLFVLLLSEN